MQLISDSRGRESNCNARPTVEHIYIMAVRPVDIVHIIAWKASSLQDFIQIKHYSSHFHSLPPLPSLVQGLIRCNQLQESRLFE